MKTRIIVAVIFIPLIIVVLYVLPPIGTPIAIAALSAIAVFEILSAVGMKDHKRVLIYSMVYGALVPFWCYVGSPQTPAVWGLFGTFVLLFIEALMGSKRLRFEMICVSFFSATFIPFFLSALVRIKLGTHGLAYVLLPFIIAFMSDGGAYFIGMAFGKHKLAPFISPKKTVEGAIGGIIGSLVGVLIFGYVVMTFTSIEVSYPILAFYGVLGSVLSQMGDLSFSLIKREYGIKDFGNALPGHGGILDRFDSVIFAAPLVEILIKILPALK